MKNNFPEDLDRFKFLSILIHDHIRIFPNYIFCNTDYQMPVYIRRCIFLLFKRVKLFFFVKTYLALMFNYDQIEAFSLVFGDFQQIFKFCDKHQFLKRNILIANGFWYFFYDSMLKIIFIILRLVKTLHSCKTAEIHK